jgi:hypothetical protein
MAANFFFNFLMFCFHLNSAHQQLLADVLYQPKMKSTIVSFSWSDVVVRNEKQREISTSNATTTSVSLQVFFRFWNIENLDKQRRQT